jgi:hypothetical protein
MRRVIGGFLLLLLVFVFSGSVLAQKGEKMMEDSGKAMATVEAQYKLPFPGMLPDSPFYKLKTLRDKITLFLIRDRYKKATRHQHLADRTLFEALKTAEKGDIPLATHTAFKGENNMTLLVNEVKAAFYSGLPLNTDIVKRAHKSAPRHQELLAGMKARAKGDAKKQFDIIIEFSQRNDLELTKLEIEATVEAELQDTQ